MKRCPECRRDYFDDSLLFCVDDGSALVEGPAASETPTAVLSAGSINAALLPTGYSRTSTIRAISADQLANDHQFFQGPIVGRTNQLAEIRKLLDDPNIRLVTLTGVGGTGKTRLAIEIARQLNPHFLDGVFLVELSSLNDPLLVVAAIAQALAVNDVDPRNAIDALLDHLSGRSVLLVLDNLEQVAPAGVYLADLLKLSPGLKILCTSREPLRLTAETEYPVPPLALPLLESENSASDLSRSEAVQMFAECARKSRPDFELTDENVEAIAAICCKLDGLPLAIELAAARSKILSPDEIVARLENSLAFLTGGAKDRPRRQQTMRAAIEWSYALLTPEEKEQFSRLSVFEGGFTLKDAESVFSTAAGNSDSIELLDIITSLNEKSLLVAERSENGELRFDMLEVVRDYAAEMLGSTPEAQRMRRLHAEYYFRVAEEARANVSSVKAADRLARLESELENLRAAICWSIGQEPEMAARIAVSLRLLWASHGHLREGQYWLQEVIKAAGDIPPKLRWEALTILGNLTQFRGDLDGAQNYYLACLDDGRTYDDKVQISKSLRGLAAVDYLRSDFPSALRRTREALAISMSINDDFGTAAALARLGDLALSQGDYSESVSRTSNALEMFRALGYKHGVAAKLANLGAAEFLAGDIGSSKSHLRESLETCDEVGDEIDIRIVFDGFAAHRLEAGDLQNAARLCGAAERIGELIEYVLEPAERRFRDLYIDRLRDAMGEREYEQAIAEGRKLTIEEASELALKTNI